MTEKKKAVKPTSMILNPEYEELGTTSYALELICGKCGKTFRVTKFATPPSDGQPGEETKEEVLANIRQTTMFTHHSSDRCDGVFADREIS